MNKTIQILRRVNFVILTFLSLNLSSQIWDIKDITFPIPSQGWRVKPVSENIAWTFGYSIAPDSSGYIFSDEEISVQRTTDGGNTWQTLTFKLFLEDGGYICDVFGLNENTAYVTYLDYNLGDVLYYTKDGGQSWQQDNSVATYFLNWVHFYDEFHGVGFADPDDDGYFEFLSTENGGATWTKYDNAHSLISDQDYGVIGDYTVSGDHIWTRTSSGRIFHSFDKGVSWEIISTAQNANGDLWGVISNDKFTLFTIYNDFENNTFSIFSKKVNSEEWLDITPDDNNGYVPGFSTVPGSNSLVCNVSEDISNPLSFKTMVNLDTVNNWNVVSSGEGYQYGFVAFYNAEIGYACEIPQSFDKPSEHVFKYIGSPLTGLLSQNAIDARIEIFPNPSSDFLKVDISSEVSNDYWILINDHNGKLIDKMVFTNQKTINEIINIKAIPQGEYMLTVANINGAITKQFIKI